MLIAGIDGCRGGWLCVTFDLAAGRGEARILRRIDELLGIDPLPGIVAIDIPIGLTEAGPRECDREARRLLGRPRGSSVFPTPIRPMLEAGSYGEACEIGRRADGRALSCQAYNILPKIREVDDFLREHAVWRGRVREVHPEVCFQLWNGGKVLAHGKKKREGRQEREGLVRSCFDREYQAARESLPRGEYAHDDLLDAFATLWTARRIARGEAVALPADPPRDGCGLRMEIVG